MTSSVPSILQTWLHPLELAEFLAGHWTRQAYWAEVASERLKWTEDVLPDLDLPNLLDYAIHPIRAWYLDDNTPVYSLTLGRKEALHAYRAGMTLYFQLDSSISGQLIAQFSRELSRPPFAFKVSIFATRRGGRTVPHVDGNENFTVQLRGTKLWKISPGGEWPSNIPEKSEQKQTELNHDFFRIFRQPESWDPVHLLEMRPGAFLYFPARFWHTVETIEDSLSLNVSVETTYTWADAILPAIRTTLLRNADWRSCDVGLWSTGNQRKQAETTLSKLLKRLSEEVQGIEDTDFLAAWNLADEEQFPGLIPPHFVRNPLVSCAIVSATVDIEFQIRIESMVRPGKTHFVTFPWKFYSSILDLVSVTGVRSYGDFEDSKELLSELLRYGVLRPCD